MVICLESSVLGGHLSNEVPGMVSGAIHLAGQRKPLVVELAGNFLRDIAGCRVDFLNPLPDTDPDLIQTLALDQRGHAGVMTASHRAGRLPRRRNSSFAGYALPDPAGLKNLVFFEWFNEQNQRVLIQSWHLQLRVTVPQWRLSKDAETAQLRQNRARRKHFLLKRAEEPPSARGLTPPTLEDPFAPHEALRDPFASAGGPAGGMTTPPVDPPHPAQRSASLADDLRRFEGLLNTSADARSQPAVMRLLATVGDLAAHLGHALRQFSSGSRTQWQFLVVDLEQSLPIFGAGVNACDRLLRDARPGTDTEWLTLMHRCLLSVELRMRELLILLRDH
ncbi:MAG: hypothetical protein K1X78_17190 [Verrucomicrobiaceae bacterium]|nr:hypothetical protein [Verrucomicrobiaceae bacterium]